LYAPYNAATVPIKIWTVLSTVACPIGESVYKKTAANNNIATKIVTLANGIITNCHKKGTTYLNTRYMLPPINENIAEPIIASGTSNEELEAFVIDKTISVTKMSIPTQRKPFMINAPSILWKKMNFSWL
jgi:hypothetical protein